MYYLAVAEMRDFTFNSHKGIVSSEKRSVTVLQGKHTAPYTGQSAR